MKDKRLFLQLNPEIADMLDNDISLKKICTIDELKSVNLQSIRVPILYTNQEVAYNKFELNDENYIRFFLQMIVNGKKKDTIVYKRCNIHISEVKSIAESMKRAFTIAKARYVEYLSCVSGIDVQMQTKSFGDIVNELRINISMIENYRGAISDNDDFLKLCSYVVNRLYEKNKISNKMHQYNIASVLFNWVVLHTSYDEKFKVASQTGMSALKYGKAVCNGYTALYNALCKICGIYVIGMAGTGKPKNTNKAEPHIWTWAKIMNRDVFIDVTWGSPVFMSANQLKKYGINADDFCDFDNFDISLSELRKEHHWKRSVYPI